MPEGSGRAWTAFMGLSRPSVRRFGLQREVIEATAGAMTGRDFLDFVAELDEIDAGLADLRAAKGT
jgi:hypothetical protein